ncbi:MAG: hypothetical protein HY017_01875 [Betaproteobacteria bacterium]|nr:hypothetical protein [Betaproteobacteria bacterium]
MDETAKRKFDPVHPGVVLMEDFLKGLEISQYRLAMGIFGHSCLAPAGYTPSG